MSSGDRLRKLIGRTRAPVTRPVIEQGTRRLGLAAGDTVIVHSSLSSLGWVNGGAVALVQALTDVVTPGGLIVMPAHSYSYADPASWEAPAVPAEWWDTIRETLPTFDPDNAPTTSMGQVVEVFRRWPGALRSRHPTASFAVWGRDAEDIASRQTYDWAQGETSALGAVYRRDGKVLLLGVGYDRNTSFHLAEYRVAGTPRGRRLLPVPADGKVGWRPFEDIDDMSDEWLLELGAAFEGAHQVTVGRIGLAECRLFPQRSAVDFAEKWLNRRYAGG